MALWRHAGYRRPVAEFEIESLKPYFYLVFFDKKQYYLWNEIFKSLFKILD